MDEWGVNGGPLSSRLHYRSQGTVHEKPRIHESQLWLFRAWPQYTTTMKIKQQHLKPLVLAGLLGSFGSAIFTSDDLNRAWPQWHYKAS